MYICTCWRHRCSKGCTCWCCGQGISCTCGYSCTLSYLDLISIGSCKWCRYRRWGHKVWTTGDLQVKCGLVHSSIVTSHIRLLLSGKLKLRICQALVSPRRRSSCISNSRITKTLFRSYFYLTLIKECWYIYLNSCCWEGCICITSINRVFVISKSKCRTPCRIDIRQGYLELIVHIVGITSIRSCSSLVDIQGRCSSMLAIAELV